MPVNRCSYIILVTIILQLPFFLNASFNKHVAIDVIYLICATIEKNLLLISKKMRRKNQISEYYTPSLVEIMKKI